MKSTYIYTTTIILLLVAGCKKELTQNPFNAVNSTLAFNTEADFTNAIRGAYAGLRDNGDKDNNDADDNYYGGQDNGAMASTPDILADNLILNQQGRKSQQDFFNYKYTANNTWELWDDAYTVILRTNYILENLNKLADGEFKDNVQGEALALRALAHFDLLRIYAKSYTSATDNDPGVPYVTSTDASLLPSRTPVKEAYDLVVQDFAQAETLISPDNGVGRLDKAAVEALLSRVYLYRGDWQKVVDEATKAIADAPEANALATATEFPDIWIDATEKDVLFKVKILDPDNRPIGVGYEQASPDGVKPEYSVDYAFYQMFANTDVRKDAYIGSTTFNGFQFNYVKKYFGRAEGNANVLDYKVIRMGEVYLNRAEAYFNLGVGQYANALADLNELRSHRYTDFNLATAIETGQALYDAILKQRRLELAFEGTRFFDLKRLNLPVQRSNFGDQADGTGVKAVVQVLPANSPLFQLPIPQSEINANTNMVPNP